MKRSINGSKIISMNNWDNSKLILLTNPNHFSFIAAKPDTSTIWPVRSNSWRCKMIISSHVIEEIMIISHLICFFISNEVFVAWSKTVISSIYSEFTEDLFHCVFESDSLILRHTGRKIPSLDVSSYSSSHRNTLKFRINISKQVFTNWDVPVMELFSITFNSMILSDQRL